MKCLKNTLKLEQKQINQILIFILVIGWVFSSYSILNNKDTIEPKYTIGIEESYCDYLNEINGGNLTNCEQIYVNNSIGWNITKTIEVI